MLWNLKNYNSQNQIPRTIFCLYCMHYLAKFTVQFRSCVECSRCPYQTVDCHVLTKTYLSPCNVICFIFIGRLISFSSQQTQITYWNIMLHWKYSQQIFRRTKVLWYELLSSLACVPQCVDFSCFPVATGCSLSHTSPLPPMTLEGARSPWSWAAVEFLTARNLISK